MNISVNCPICLKDFEVSRRYFNNSNKEGWKIYCSKECRTKKRQTGRIFNCTNCGKEVYKRLSNLNRSKTGNVYCSRSCSAANNNRLFKKWENHPKYRTGIGHYRNYKLNSVENPKCEKCGYNNTAALEIHHKDKNRQNNKLGNLEILCCNCHTIEHRSKIEDVV